MAQPTLPEIGLKIVAATAETAAPFGVLTSAGGAAPVFAGWPGATVFGPFSFGIETEGELLVVRSDAKAFPHKVGLIERHPLHTQAYLPLNTKPFVMVLGKATEGDLPEVGALQALIFSEGNGIILHKGSWHDFPYALEDGTQFAVLLSAAAHRDTLEHKPFPLDAKGPDLDRVSLRERATIWVTR